MNGGPYAQPLIITDEAMGAIRAHMERDFPDEACGVVAGRRGGVANRHVPMVNADPSPAYYEFDRAEQLRVWAEMDRRGEEPLVIYHSHPRGRAVPSRDDIRLAAEPDAHYLIVTPADARAYRIVGGVAYEQQIEVVTSTAPGNNPEEVSSV